jgi:hypothetical protein
MTDNKASLAVISNTSADCGSDAGVAIKNYQIMTAAPFSTTKYSESKHNLIVKDS